MFYKLSTFDAAWFLLLLLHYGDDELGLYPGSIILVMQLSWAIIKSETSSILFSGALKNLSGVLCYYVDTKKTCFKRKIFCNCFQSLP